MSALARTTLAIERDLLEKFDAWMAKHSYASRSEAVRDLMRNTLVEQEWASPGAEVLAVLSIVFDHGKHTLSQALVHIQHEAHHCILCSQHVHLDRHRCAEVIVMQGKAGQLRRLGEAIIATRGVRAGKLTLMSTSV
ncbi:MAG: nickel-responsive transcriptional regulator NikR [Actinobacteria bacterium]|nr:nickel-responsive transcriptional regulator NikR [Actinomycetota bacterium]